MNIYHLKYFIDAARFQSVSKSAQANLVSHSAVSQAIKSLEGVFGVDLIYHSKRKFQLTPQGELCLVEGQRLLAQFDQTKESIRHSHKEVTGELVVWAPQSLVVESLYKALQIYRKKYPKVKVSFHPGAAAQVRSSVMSGHVHVGLLLDDNHLDLFDSISVKKGQFVIISKKEKPNIAESSFILTAREKVEVVHLIKNYKSKFKKDLMVDMEVMSWGVIKNLVMKNFALGYVPDYCVSYELEAGKLFKVDPPGSAFQYTVKAIWPKNRSLHPNAQLFVELLKEECHK